MVKCHDCIFWITAEQIGNHVGVCRRYPEMKDLNTLITVNYCLCHKFTEHDHFCGEYIDAVTHKGFLKSLE